MAQIFGILELQHDTVTDQSSRGQEENVAKVIGPTSSEGFLVINVTSTFV